MERMPVANVIIAGGSIPDLFECLHSLDESTYNPLRTLVVDNSSNGIGGEIEVSFPMVVVVRAEKPLTFAQAANFGFGRVFSEGARAAMLLNDDVTVHNDAHAKLVDAMNAGGIGVYSPEIWPYANGSARRRRRIDWNKRLSVSEAADSQGQAVDIDYAEGSAALISAAVFDELGGFDEDFGFYYEDADFSVRARDAGFVVREVAGARVWHKGSVSAGNGLSPFKAYWRSRNTLKFAMKHRGHSHVATNALYHFGGFVAPALAKAALGALVGRQKDVRILGAIMRGTWDLFTGNGHIALAALASDDEQERHMVALLHEAL